MVRTLIQLDEATYDKLRQRAFRQKRSLSSLIREIAQDAVSPGRRLSATRASQFRSVA
ncbi:MAG: ribbon-helix-helix protein, CopG family, partial [Acidobacteria bacterium]|nr:ribbon-helix-helix protein, CopG family [Acidobacteriota bacterium]